MNKIDKSIALFDQAKSLMPGGVNSPVRAFKNIHGNPIFFEKAQGCDMPMESTKTCCENESFTVKGQEDLKLSLTEIDFGPVLFIATAHYDETTAAAIGEGHSQLFLYDPPPYLKTSSFYNSAF